MPSALPIHLEFQIQWLRLNTGYDRPTGLIGVSVRLKKVIEITRLNYIQSSLMVLYLIQNS